MLLSIAMSDFSSWSTGNIISFILNLSYMVANLLYFCASDTPPQFLWKLASLFSVCRKFYVIWTRRVQGIVSFSLLIKAKNARVAYEANKTAQVLFPSFIEATVPKLLKWPFVIKSWIDCKAQLGKCSRLNRTGESLWKLLSWRQMFKSPFKSWIFTIPPKKIMVCFCCCFVSHFSPFSWSGILLSSSLL